MKDIRLVFQDGTLLDTSDNNSKNSFQLSHGHILQQLQHLSLQLKQNRSLYERIKKKYQIKNTTGYSLNALVDYDDPFEILKHLIVGSEGTLAFIGMRYIYLL